MKKIYYLATCSTCKEIIKTAGIAAPEFELQDIKTAPITRSQLQEMHQLAGSYEALFSRKARKFAELKLKDKDLNETEMRELILGEYTFLKRPVLISEKKILIGADVRTWK